MKNKITNFALTLLSTLGLLIPQTSYGTHVMGSDFYWQSMGNHRYEVTINYYRDCGGIPHSATKNIQISCVSGASGSASVTLNRVSIQNVSNNCASDTTACNPPNTMGAGFGVEKHVFKGVVDFNSGQLKSFRDQGCCRFKFTYSECCRNTILTTINAGNFFNEAEIDLCNIDNSITPFVDDSPQFSNSPIWYLCCNQTVTYNNGVTDVNGDSLVFSLVPAMSNLNNNAAYVSPFNPTTWPMTAYCASTSPCACDPTTSPKSGFCFDATTGDISFTPTDCNEVGVVVIKVEQYRQEAGSNNWLNIGYTHRDLQWLVNNCNNAIPQFDSIAPLEVCEGNSICFTVRATDEQLSSQSWNDTIDLTWNMGLPGATFQVGPHDTIIENGVVYAVREVEICWQTSIGDARPAPYYYSVTAKDKGCPINLMSSVGSYVRVLPNNTQVIDSIYGPIVIDSATNSMKYYVLNAYSNYVYDWSIQNGTIDSGQGTTEVYVTWTGNGSGTLTLIANHSNPLCGFYQDTVSITEFFLNLDEILKDFGIHIYPNPSHNNLFIKTEKAITRIKLLDTHGRMIKDEAFSEELDISNLSPGVYLLQFTDKEGHIAVGRFIKN